jgi:hypothetical protein
VSWTWSVRPRWSRRQAARLRQVSRTRAPARRSNARSFKLCNNESRCDRGVSSSGCRGALQRSSS